MLAQARRVHAWAPNIAVKLPATAAGVEVIEHLAEEGIPICATINVSVSQAIAVAESYARGKKKALAAGVKPPLCIVVQQVGRLDDYLRDVAQDMKLGLDESVITMAGLAVAKRTYQIFEQRGYDAVIMPAGLRGAYHLTEMAGGLLLYALPMQLPDALQKAVSSVAACNAPIAMIILGYYLAEVPLKQIFTSGAAWRVSAMRLLLIPIISALIIVRLPLIGAEMKQALVIAASAPVGINVAIYAELLGKDYKKAVILICQSTILCLITMPLVIVLTELLIA